MPDHMQRNREQKGSVVRIGQFWCVRYADWRVEDGKRARKQGLTHKLAPILPEHARLKRAPQSVEKLLREFMASINVDRDAPERCATVGQFVTDVWLPFAESRYATSTVTVYRFYWKNILSPGCGDKLLRDFGTHAGQTLLDQIAKKNPEMRLATLHKLKSILSAVFKLAIQQNYRSGSNPMRETTLPKAPGAQETHAHDLSNH